MNPFEYSTIPLIHHIFHQCGLGYPGPPGIPGPRGFPGSRGFDGKIETLFLFLFFSVILFICIFSVWIRSMIVVITGRHPNFLPLRALPLARDLI